MRIIQAASDDKSVVHLAIFPGEATHFIFSAKRGFYIGGDGLQIRSGNGRADFRTSPTVSIGYSYTRWKEISKELGFFIDSERRPVVITDNGAPTNWSLPNLGPDKHTTMGADSPGMNGD